MMTGDTMVYIPTILSNKVYEHGSLKNTAHGFEFCFANNITPLSISGMRDIKIEVDGVRYPTDVISLKLGNKPISLEGGQVQGAYTFAKSEKLLIAVRGAQLADGNHSVRISFITNEYGGATMKVADITGKPAQVDFPLIRFVIDVVRRVAGGDIGPKSQPLHIQGNFPILNSILDKVNEATGAGTQIHKKRLCIEGELGGVPLDPDFSRLATCIRREEADRVPMFEPDIAVPIQEWFLGRPINTAEDEVEFYIRAGYDVVPVVAPFFAPRLMRHASGADEIESMGADDNERAWLTESEGIIETVKDVENFPWPDPEQVDLSSFAEIAEILPPKMKIMGALVPGTIFGNVSQSMGLEKFSYALYDTPAVVEALFEIVGSSFERIVKRLVKMPELGCVLMADDLGHTGGPLVSPAIYRKFVFPWYKKIGEILHGAGLPFIYHSDGTLLPVMNDLADCGINAIHPIEPQAMDIVEVKKNHGDKFCIFGNIDLEYTLTRGSVADVEALVKKRIRELGPGGGWGLSASNSVPDYVIPANYRAMLETGMKYGKYPIAIS
jgi:uroporphyrinogen decarboxylase